MENNNKQIIAKYMGKELKKTGNRPDGTEWKLYKIKVEPEEGRLWSFTCFMPWTKKDGNPRAGISPKDMEEGQSYKITYSEKVIEGYDHPAKTFICAYKATANAQQQLLNNSTPKQPISTVNLDKDKMEKIIDAYFKLSPDVQNVNHFVGTVFRTLNEKLAQPLVEEFEKRTKKE